MKHFSQHFPAMFYISIFFILLLQLVTPAWSGGWDLDKGPAVSTMKGELVCIGCALHSNTGSNSQCGIYTSHTIGLKMGDGSLWQFMNNQTGHDVIYSHNLLEGKKSTVTGFMYPIAHMIEIVSIDVDGVTDEQMSDAAFAQDKLIGSALLNRKKGQAPVIYPYNMLDE